MEILKAIQNNKLLMLNDYDEDLGYITAQNKTGNYLFVYKYKNNFFDSLWYTEKALNDIFSSTEKEVEFTFEECLIYTKKRYTDIEYIEQLEENHKGMILDYNENWTWGF